jgi:hypothetical protein
MTRASATSGAKNLSSISIITLNEQPFQVKRNLYIALLHLRSLTHPTSIWVDTTCINQMDTKERNDQVAIMSFTYMRAQSVVSWQGVKRDEKQLNPFWSMSLDWKAV